MLSRFRGGKFMARAVGFDRVARGAITEAKDDQRECTAERICADSRPRVLACAVADVQLGQL